jgi:anti-sigma factor RsiW
MMSDPITEADFHAFVDDQLPAERRLEVEDHLARNPPIAARVMADMRARDALRLAFVAGAPHPQNRAVGAALRLQRSLLWRRMGLKLRRAAGIAILIGAGWLAHAQTGFLQVSDTAASPRPPIFVEDARHAYETSLVRARMASQPQIPAYNPQEILDATGITMPDLPRDWRVVDTQIFPARSGPSVELTMRGGPLGEMSLFAGRSTSFDVIRPTAAPFDRGVTVYWQSGEMAYALTGSAPEPEVERAATRLERMLR